MTFKFLFALHKEVLADIRFDMAPAQHKELYESKTSYQHKGERKNEFHLRHFTYSLRAHLGGMYQVPESRKRYHFFVGNIEKLMDVFLQKQCVDHSSPNLHNGGPSVIAFTCTRVQTGVLHYE